VDVRQVRRFNRLVTERVGALEDDYLARSRPLGQARLLWEIGVEGSDVRRLRTRLGLDAGYVSRLLRSLEATGLVKVDPSQGDRRVRTVRLTAAGHVEHDLLDRGSDELARSFLEPLSESRRRRLVDAMAEVERLLTAALVRIDEVDPARPDAQRCLRAYVDELGHRFRGGFDPEQSISARLDELRPPAGAFLLATLRGEPVGCGALKFHGEEPTELKRMGGSDPRGLACSIRVVPLMISRRLPRLTNRERNAAVATRVAHPLAELVPLKAHLVAMRTRVRPPSDRQQGLCRGHLD